ncbi:EDD domain protein, DegV family [Longilinea arvoryzae]|uniref:EDD domain protein, DegV family n=1 Tax=Longilinea arvoryzae TaxID=360412 RepID=A0A0S7BMD0_9CHLR|nr:DegV family protein [Longilinea arvoryzae]GAP14965.1 EDD domain protein, DegV family [Longilinea arvoryzae]
MIEIITDSTSDLSPELLERFHIKRLPLTVFVDNHEVKDGDMTLRELFDAVDRTGALPKTSAVPVVDFSEAFKAQNDVICIDISSQLSATYQNSVLAAAEVKDKRIATVDSLNLSTGIGLLVVKAAELRDQGRSFDEIVSEIRATVPKIHTSFTIDTLDYLYKGGRCSALANIFGSLLHIRPVIEVRSDGTMGVKEKIGGARKRALLSMVAEFNTLLPTIDLHRVFITHTGCDADAAFLESELRKLAKIDEICITYAGSTIASHCGPNTIGILYILK